MIWGLQPGPLLFVEKADFVWGLIASMYLGNIAGLIVVLTCVPLFASILRVPFSIIAPVILVICAIGAYTVHNSMFDVWLMLVFGVMGYVFKKLDYPLAPLVLALVLGDARRERVPPVDADVAGRHARSSSPTGWWARSPRSRCCCSSGRSSRRALAILRGRNGRQPPARSDAMAVIAMTQEMATLGKDVALGVCEALGLQQVRHEVGDVVAGRMQVKKSLIRRIREGKASKIESGRPTRRPSRSSPPRRSSTSR